MPEAKTRAERFLEAFNSIDYSLRIRYNLNRSMGFSDLIRKSVALNYIVRKYENDLIDYSRLRNAIVHQGSSDRIIAEPHLDVVERIEKIERLINTPPRAIDTVSRRDVVCVEHNDHIKDVIKLMASCGYSNLPVLEDGEIIGIANGQKILNCLGDTLLNNIKIDKFLTQPIDSVISLLPQSMYYLVESESITIEDALKHFHNNSKLLAIILTKSGSEKDKPIGIITGHDTMSMTKILEDY